MLSSSAAEIPTPRHGSIRGDLLAIVHAVIAYLTSPVGLPALHVTVSLTVNDHTEARRAFWEGRLNALRPVVERGIAVENCGPTPIPGYCWRHW